jgi:N-acetylmuramoyl-L-alanine amidase
MILRKLVVGVTLVFVGVSLFNIRSFSQVHKVTGVLVDVRKEPSSEEQILGIVIKDQEFNVLETKDEWHKVEFGTREGWIRERNLEPLRKSLGILEVTVDTLNVRTKASIEGELLGQIFNGEAYQILKLSGEWIQIEYKEKEGWIYAAHIKPNEPLRDNITVIVEDVNLRMGPSTSHKVLDTLKKGTQLTYRGNQNGWVHVETQSGEEGWVLYSLLEANGVVIPRPRPTENTVSRGGSITDRNTDLRTRITNYARGFLGTRYVWGGTTPNGFDCSGLILYVYRNFGISLNRVASDQARQGRWVAKENLRPGDLVFFATDGGTYLSHAGIYIGGGNMIHASGGQFRAGEVRISPINSGYFAQTYVTARTFLD